MQQQRAGEKEKRDVLAEVEVESGSRHSRTWREGECAGEAGRWRGAGRRERGWWRRTWRVGGRWVAEGEGGRVLAINAPHKKSSPSLMGSTLLEGTRRAFARGKKEGEKVRRGGVGAREQRQEDEQKARERERESERGWRWCARGRDGEASEGLFLARPTSGKTPLIGTWLPVGATNFAGGGGRYLLRFRLETVCARRWRWWWRRRRQRWWI